MGWYCNLGIRGGRKGFREASGSTWDPDSGDVTKGWLKDCV